MISLNRSVCLCIFKVVVEYVSYGSLLIPLLTIVRLQAYLTFNRGSDGISVLHNTYEQEHINHSQAVINAKLR